MSIKPNHGVFCGFDIYKGYYMLPKQQYIASESRIGDDTGISDVIQEILNSLKITVPIKVYIAKDENNCFATISNGKRIIVADHLFLHNVNKHSKTNWGAISILAHEVGHHIAGFANDQASKLNSELDADYWSGYILHKLGASKDASVKCIMRYGTEHNTSSHPNKYSRAETIKLGWDDALKGSYDIKRCAECN
ncbi:hypothetical protein [Siphonobacter sp.]|uniref:hypothetical protein n=1 Tax=Siphonobacter sp. TaxID=1869184 RepID=UPI003B3B5296